MSRFWTTFIRSLALGLWVGGLLSGCGRGNAASATALPTPVVIEAATEAVSPTAARATPTATPLPAAWVVVQPDGAPAAARAWAEAARPVAQDAGLRWVTVPDLDTAAAEAPVSALVALPPVPVDAAQAWAAAHPEARVLAWASDPDAVPPADALSPNLTVVVSQPLTWEQRFFLAGYTTVLATQHWRAGLLYTSPPGYAAQTLAAAFDRGAVYWCGPCVPAYPPMVAYPFTVEVPPGVEDAAAWQNAARNLLAQAPLEAVYLRGEPAAATIPLFHERGVVVIWDGAPNPDADLSVYPDPWGPLDASWLTAWLAGERTGVLPAPWAIEMSNPDAFSPGRARLVQQLFQALRAGRVAAEPVGGP